MIYEVIDLNKAHEATLTCYRQQVNGEFPNIPKRPVMIVIPGGGYQMCSEREADPIALPYLEAGYHVFILRYAVKKNAKWPNPLRDYEDAVRLIRGKAEEWALYPDKVAVVGFSAGGHLAGAAATLSAPECRPNAALLGYAVLNEQSAKECEATAPDLVSAVDQDTCPCFLFATRNDNIVPIANSLSFMEALNKAGISFESHIYAYGPHGFSTGNSAVMAPGSNLCSRATGWVKDSIEWLKDVFGEFGSGELTDPKCGRYVNADAAGGFSIDNTMGYLMRDPRSRQILAPLLEAWKQQAGRQESQEDEGGNALAEAISQRMTLREILSYANLPKEAVDNLDTALKSIQ